MRSRASCESAVACVLGDVGVAREGWAFGAPIVAISALCVSVLRGALPSAAARRIMASREREILCDVECAGKVGAYH